MSFKKLLFVLTVIISLNVFTTVGLCLELEYPEPWSVQPVEEEM